MKKIILYGSRYGSSRRYAEQLSALSGIPTASFADAHALSDAKILVYVGGLYAGGVLGMKKVLRAHAPVPDQRLIVATVGLADPSLAENVQIIRASLQKQLSPEWFARASLFHLRGAIDYQKLSPGHRAAMALLYQSLRKTPPEKQTAEDQALVETYGKRVDFVDFSALSPILEALLT